MSMRRMRRMCDAILFVINRRFYIFFLLNKKKSIKESHYNANFMQYFTWTKRHQLSEIQLNDNNNILANVIKLDICVVCSIGFYNISFAIWSE